MSYISNVHVHYQIAEEAYAAMEKAYASSPPDSHTGSKQGTICIAFSAIYFEALFFIVASEWKGIDVANKLDRLPYEDRLRKLDCPDPTLIEDAKRFRESRRDLIHEKAIDLRTRPDLSKMRITFVRPDAEEAISFIRKFRRLVGAT